jgi:hypothetical protein
LIWYRVLSLSSRVFFFAFFSYIDEMRALHVRVKSNGRTMIGGGLAPSQTRFSPTLRSHVLLGREGFVFTYILLNQLFKFLCGTNQVLVQLLTLISDLFWLLIPFKSPPLHFSWYKNMSLSPRVSFSSFHMVILWVPPPLYPCISQVNKTYKFVTKFK